MKINIVAPGKIKESFLREGIEEYSKRIQPYAALKVYQTADAKPLKNNLSEIEKAMEKEACEAEKYLSGYVIALDINGKSMGSEELAGEISALCLKGTAEFSFLIGGSHGIADRLKKKADMLLSFGKMTFPHQLMRLMLTEQIYRAMTILNNHPYHK